MIGFRRESLWQAAVAMIGAALFVGTGDALRGARRPDVFPEIEVTLPVFVQVAMTGGDRYLAANLGAIRTLVAESGKMKPDEFQIQARVQTDVSWLNPAHEDNYYVASAVLPWNGQVAAAQTILRRASLARPFDYQPAFYYAFNLVHFSNDPVGASEWLRQAASKLDNEDDRLMLENFAARWVDRSDDIGLAIAVVESMAKQAKRRDFRQYLLLRVERLRGLRALRQAADAYEKNSGRRPHSLDQLVSAGLIGDIPKDPFGFGYRLDERGVPIFGGVRVDAYGNKY